MKKLISIVLTICMLFSMISVVSAADISEDERLALLSEKDYTYILDLTSDNTFTLHTFIDGIRVYSNSYSYNETNYLNQLVCEDIFGCFGVTGDAHTTTFAGINVYGFEAGVECSLADYFDGSLYDCKDSLLYGTN